MPERSNGHAWKACVPARVPRVRIPLCPPVFFCCNIFVMSILRFLFIETWGRNGENLKSKRFYSIENSNMCAILHLVSKRRKSSSVPGQALGFSLQHTKMAGLLASLESGATVEYEGLDDLTVYHPTGEMQLWQIKSALASNPRADRSVELWKALANWRAIHLDRESTIFKINIFSFPYHENEVY